MSWEANEGGGEEKPLYSGGEPVTLHESDLVAAFPVAAPAAARRPCRRLPGGRTGGCEENNLCAIVMCCLRERTIISLGLGWYLQTKMLGPERFLPREGVRESVLDFF